MKFLGRASHPWTVTEALGAKRCGPSPGRASFEARSRHELRMLGRLEMIEESWSAVPGHRITAPRDGWAQNSLNWITKIGERGYQLQAPWVLFGRAAAQHHCVVN